MLEGTIVIVASVLMVTLLTIHGVCFIVDREDIIKILIFLEILVLSCLLLTLIG